MHIIHIMNAQVENNIGKYCHFCEDHPCLWSQHRHEILESVQAWAMTLDKNPSNRFICNRCYIIFTNLHHGVLGNGVRVDPPQCVKDGIRREFPDPNNEYVGFKP